MGRKILDGDKGRFIFCETLSRNCVVSLVIIQN